MCDRSAIGTALIVMVALSIACQSEPENEFSSGAQVDVEPPRRTKTYGFLAGRPSSRIIAPGVLEVTFDTEQPTPAAVLYLGINDIQEELDYPRYRLQVVEEVPAEGTPAEGKGPAEARRTRHRIEADFRLLLAQMPNTQFEPRICWRAEVFVPNLHSTRFVEGRQYFNPDTLGDTVNITMGPYVDQITPTGAIIRVETDRQAEATIKIGERQIVAGGGPLYEISIDGLQPETKYEYRVQVGDTQVRPYRFRTSGGNAFRFAAMCDSREGFGGGMQNATGVNAFALYCLGSAAYYQNADFVLFPGDLINGYTTSEDDFRNQIDSFRRAMGPVHARIPIYEGMGNHEALVDLMEGEGMRDKQGGQSAEVVFADLFTNPVNGPTREQPDAPPYDEIVYYFDWNHARFIVLNNNYWFATHPHRDGGNLEGFVMQRQLEWLRSEVERADADDKIQLLFFAAQEPPFPNGGHTNDAMWYNGGDTNHDGRIDGADIKIVHNRNDLWEIVASSPKAVAFITGDEHAYSRLLLTQETKVGHRAKSDGSQARYQYPVWQVTTGGAGAPWYDKDLHLPWSSELRAHSTQPHFVLFSIEGEQVRLDVPSQTGESVDETELRTADGRTGGP